MSSTEWQDQAKCRTGTHPPEMWHTEGSTAAALETREYARAICWTCDVREECLKFAIANEPAVRTLRYGIWGGLNPNERHAYARQERAEGAA